MSLKDEFQAAVDGAQQITSRPSNEDLLALYSLFKQATVGDATGKRPGVFDLKGRAKFDAWAARKGTSADDAMTSYIALVTRLRG